MRLSAQTASLLPSSVARPGYDREAQAHGIVHLGLGAFHRAHQAVFTDDAMAAGDRDWAITGVSLRSASVRDQLVPQDGLYTVTGRGSDGDNVRLIGAVRDVIVAPERPAAVAAAIADQATRIVSLTVTEKGYHRRPDGSLDVDAVRAAGDTIYQHLAAGLATRMAARTPGVTLLCCDNLPANGRVLAGLVGEWLAAAAPALAGWFTRECTCPSTMVDRIVPATTSQDRARLAEAIGLVDEAAVVTEPFRQWVIEDRFAAPRPRWQAVGAQIVDDVASYETAKLRMLNGAHSALAYLGRRAGLELVSEAVAHPPIRMVVERLMRDEAASTIATTPGQDLPRYADTLFERFGNTALPHRLDQIATDGSQKIGPRWLEPLAIRTQRGEQSPATLTALAAWILDVRGDRRRVDDPSAAQLDRLWRQAGIDAIVAALFGSQGLFGSVWTATADDQIFLDTTLRALDA